MILNPNPVADLTIPDSISKSYNQIKEKNNEILSDLDYI